MEEITYNGQTGVFFNQMEYTNLLENNAQLHNAIEQLEKKIGEMEQ